MHLSLLQSALVSMIIISSLSFLYVCKRDSLTRLILKPLTTLLIIFLAASFITDPNGDQQWTALLIVAGLCLSLAGDIFLQRETKWFRFGLGSFLLAHLAYIFAIVIPGTGISFVGGYGMSAAIAVCCLAAIYLPMHHHLEKERIPVAIYAIVIGALLFVALLQWLNGGSLVFLVGVILFSISDSLLAVNRFVKPWPTAQYQVMSTYYSAQLLIALSLKDLAL
ncbi:MAG: lysoplasmalogenase [Pseudomonadales bacterium]